MLLFDLKKKGGKLWKMQKKHESSRGLVGLFNIPERRINIHSIRESFTPDTSRLTMGITQVPDSIKRSSRGGINYTV